MFGLFKRKGGTPSVPAGYRAYAVGDVHGRLDLLEPLLDDIVTDAQARGNSRNLLVMLGDLIDRGAWSAQVIDRLRSWKPHGWRSVFLMGNHEEVLLQVLDGDVGLMRQWFRFGGTECLASYGVAAGQLAELDDPAALALVRQVIPPDHVAFIRGFGDTLSLGDYLFVHAGIRPGVPLEQQARSDLRWIREPFLSHGDRHEALVVHGHTIHDEVVELSNRIALDTGAYRTDRLSAMGFEGEQRWLLQSAGGDRVADETNQHSARLAAIRSA
ncbi:serine/threonine protein phosphatase [Sphingomonas ginkgonis]|uniref:Serine/threonine protein phosphatase n=1 Tax=Sphingomonas ginkgonis TaxID=2315330 RepID=A0A429VAY4_9SPHN|nr:metallophosphoesterase [Sphingomonas ginkgonis]RST31002.1 serine/threonine protein phosphatase [Sphingomonas ginkgonis]